MKNNQMDVRLQTNKYVKSYNIVQRTHRKSGSNSKKPKKENKYARYRKVIDRTTPKPNAPLAIEADRAAAFVALVAYGEAVAMNSFHAFTVALGKKYVDSVVAEP